MTKLLKQTDNPAILFNRKIAGLNMDYGIIASVVGFVASVATMWGILQQKVHQIEDRITVLEKDHDILIEIRTKIDLLLDSRIPTKEQKSKR